MIDDRSISKRRRGGSGGGNGGSSMTALCAADVACDGGACDVAWAPDGRRTGALSRATVPGLLGRSCSSIGCWVSSGGANMSSDEGGATGLGEDSARGGAGAALGGGGAAGVATESEGVGPASVSSPSSVVR